MDQTKLYNSLDGLFAFDTGSVNSGINDENLRDEISDYLDSLDENEFRIIMSTFVRKHFLSDQALGKGYGIEDVKSFIEWLDKYMGVQL